MIKAAVDIWIAHTRGAIRILSLAVVCVMIATTASAQQNVKLEHADQLSFERDKGYQKLTGNVVFTQNQTTIYCDSAYLYKEQNSVEAFGRVRITEGDSVTVTSRRLEYDGNTKKARLRDNVVFVKLGTATLYTDQLDYDRPANMAYYYDGGKLVDSINTLTSVRGYYDVNSNMASFKRDVHVENPDYTMTSDSLQYNSRTKVVYFRTPTTAVDKEGRTFIYEGGEYDTRTKQSDFTEGIAESPSYQLKGNDWRLDRVRQLYQVRGDVEMISKEENLIIYSQAVDYYKDAEITKVFNNAWVAKVTDDLDTLFITADTLVSIDSEIPENKRLLAYHNVKIYKKDMQGVADSLAYITADSIIHFYRDPVLWNTGNQMTADSVSMLIENNTISKIFLVRNAFVVSQDTLGNFNQIKGRDMTAEFKDGNIQQVIVRGNGESLYFVFDEDDLTFTGINRIICSNILIRFREGKVHDLNFYVQPDASFVPPHELTEDMKTLKGFSWREDIRPAREDVVPAKKVAADTRKLP
ncbi:MAG: organic solvent tolerance protein OstA [Cyclobacteriaceae bacterium]|nr:organic solvent tolerance protein OstA [Cyclobacteriaceae bacterium]